MPPFIPAFEPCSSDLSLFYPSVFHALLEEFWATVDPKATDIEDRLAEWQHFWNWDRLHVALGGNTPIDHICERLVKTPLTDEVEARYDPRREKIRVADYRVDMALVQLK